MDIQQVLQQVLQQVKNDPGMVQRIMQSPDGQKLMQLLTGSDGVKPAHVYILLMSMYPKR